MLNSLINTNKDQGREREFDDSEVVQTQVKSDTTTFFSFSAPCIVGHRKFFFIRTDQCQK